MPRNPRPNELFVALGLALATAAQRQEGLELREDEIECNAQAHGTMVQVESNLERFIVDAQRRHAVIESAVLALARINQQLEKMSAFTALSGVAREDVPLLTRKFAVVAQGIDPRLTEQQFERVLEIRGFPSTPPGAKVDVKRLLSVRQSPECVAFREWLSKAEDLSDAEIANVVCSARARVAEALDSTAGKTVRFLVTTGAGFIPGVGTITGTAASAMDMFGLGALFSKSGPAAFVSSMYPSIFKP